jgi:hypothetical protein
MIMHITHIIIIIIIILLCFVSQLSFEFLSKSKVVVTKDFNQNSAFFNTSYYPARVEENTLISD